ncbi:MAG: hypothetical protein U5N58_07440 [Actinomycetota bacterium]|nr:hypothetical protein [Actinomycetota bacterium]
MTLIDCGRVSRQLGGYSQLLNLSAELKELNIDWLQDIVPNHMAFVKDNP